MRVSRRQNRLRGVGAAGEYSKVIDASRRGRTGCALPVEASLEHVGCVGCRAEQLQAVLPRT
jgi:hypothetical protein